MIDIKDKKDCCGCTACMNICPNGAIKMEKDEEGFTYPKIDKTLCINCNLCDKVCPIQEKKKEKSRVSIGYIVNNKDDKIRMQSTSGGAFSAISDYIITQGGIVYGACFDDDFNVLHIGVKNKEEIYRLRGSKYVQSDLRETFKEIKKHLEEEKMVCFSGTPCQVEGLRNYLRKDYENLITVDVVCRAVPSPKLYKKYLKYIQKEKLDNEKITKVSFRDKEKYGYKYSTMTIKGEKKEYRNGIETDTYLRAFFNNISDRPSCYSCQFRTIDRKSDFTIWDCFITENFEKSMDDNLGTTRVVIHTKKGEKVFNSIKDQFIYKQIEVEKLISDMKELKYDVEENKIRKQFFEDIDKISTEELFNKYFPDTLRVKLERFARKRLVHFPFYKKLKRVAKNILKR